MKLWQRWFGGAWLSRKVAGERRKAARRSAPAIRAHFWSGGGLPDGREIVDISSAGLYLRTTEQWYPGTMITITLQKTDGPDNCAPAFLSVTSRIVRCGKDGFGCEFIFSKVGVSKDEAGGIEAVADKGAVERFLE